jgi:phosphohistidine phosphatase
MNRRVLVLRHAEAEEPAHALIAGRSDAKRELTKDGRRKMLTGARGLGQVVEHIDHLVSSPLVRAVQTADLLAEVFPDAKRQEHAGLSPGFPHAALMGWIARYKGTLALVGHEPDLSQWVGYMVTGEARSVVLMKKGACCCLKMPESPLAGEAHIVWHMPLKQLRDLAPET